MKEVFCFTWIEHHEVNIKASNREEAEKVFNRRFPDNNPEVVPWAEFDDTCIEFDSDGVCDDHIPGLTSIVASFSYTLMRRRLL